MTPSKLKSMYPIILNGTNNLIGYIKSEIKNDKTRAFDARELCAKYTCDTISGCIYGVDAQSFTSDNPVYYKMGQQLIKGIVDSVKSFLPVKRLPWDVERFFIDITTKAIAFRIDSKTERDDILSHLISLREKSGLNFVDATGHCVTLFLDGFETTSLTIHHALYELGRNKDAQSKLRKEIEDNVGEDGQMSYDKLLDLPYLDQVFYETLRLHPPLPFTTRVCCENFETHGMNGKNVVIKKGAAVWIPIYSLHKDSGKS